MFNFIFSILIAIIVSYVIFFSINIKIIYRGPNSENIRHNIYKNYKTNKCYKLEPELYKCPER
jgi:uncharacterized membrane protein